MSDAPQALILGDAPVTDSIAGQYLAKGWEAVSTSSLCLDGHDAEAFSEFVLAPGRASDDVRAMSLLRQLSEAVPAAAIRPKVHLILNDAELYRLVQINDLASDITDRLDVYPSTMPDCWARNVLVTVPGRSNKYKPLDYKAVTADSPRTVHLVISGTDDYAQALAINAAMVSHYPNYRPADKLPKRTRVTIIADGVAAFRDSFVAKYQTLFDHSCYRTVDLAKGTTCTHRPLYEGSRADFVDVEWEFVDGTILHPAVIERIGRWAASDTKLLTVALCGNLSDNLAQAQVLGRLLAGSDVPVLVRTASDVYSMLSDARANSNIYPFGMADSGYDIDMPLVGLARLLCYFYACSYSDKGVPTVLPADEVEQCWASEHSYRMRMSNLYNVMTLAPKMRSLGHDEADFAAFYALNQAEIEMMAETEHNRWCVERLIMGSRPCTDAERQLICDNISQILATEAGQTPPEDLKRNYKRLRDVHYDLCAYAELGVDPTGKNARVYDYDLTACIPLMVSTFINQQQK